MTQSFLQLSLNEQSQILNTISTKPNINKSPKILEKDVWLCWALDKLFSMPDRFSMAFKGGTSLSKVYNLINRFSEDIDITINYNSFGLDDPLLENLSRTKRKNISNQIKPKVTEHIKAKIIPYLQDEIHTEFKINTPEIILDENGEKLFIHYPSALGKEFGYIQDNVLIEFGGRNSTLPNNTHLIQSYLSSHIDNLAFPSANVTVLSPQKTFWEKATLIHKNCNSPHPKINANRISRHWYDITQLYQTQIGKDAIRNHELLNDVIKIQNIFYYAGYAKYDQCLAGKLKLIPDDPFLTMLKNDFNNMCAEKMFYGNEPEFKQIISLTKHIENEINHIYFLAAV